MKNRIIKSIIFFSVVLVMLGMNFGMELIGTVSEVSAATTITTTIPATYDTYISKSKSYESYNTSPELTLRHDGTYERHIYIKFDLSSIPTDADIISAKMNYYITYHSGYNNPNAYLYLKVNRATSDVEVADWDEKATEVDDGDSTTYLPPSPHNVWFDLTCTKAVEQIATNGQTNYGFHVYPTAHGSNDDDYIDVASMEYATADYRPYLEVTYVTNDAPEISNIVPSNNYIFTDSSVNIVPEIIVSDIDNDTLTCKYYIDSEVIASETKIVANTSTQKNVIFSPIYFNSFPSGTHTIKFEVSESKHTVESLVNFTINKQSPTINTINCTPQDGEFIDETDTNYEPIIAVSDVNGDDLTCSYYIDSESIPRETKTATNTTTEQTITFSPIDMSNLTEGDHTIKFTTYDGELTSQQIINFKVDKTAPTVDTFTVSSTQDSITIDAFATDSGSGLEANPYRYTVYNSGSMTLVSDSGWINDTSYTVNSLNVGILYTVKFEAKDKAGHITTTTNDISTSIHPPVFDASITSTDSIVSLLINDANPTYTYYQITVSTDDYDRDVRYVSNFGTLTDEPVWITIPSKNIKVTDLLPNKTYSLKIKAKSLSGQETEESSVVTATTQGIIPNIPANIKYEVADSKVILEWDETDYATSYEIMINENGTVIDNGNSLTYSHTGLSENSQYIYKIRAMNISGTSNWSEPLIITTLISEPTIPTNIVTTAFSTEVHLTWDNQIGEYYDIEVDGEITNNKNNNSYIHLNLMPETQHTYRVRTRRYGKTSEWSDYKTVMTNALAAPTNIPSISVNELTNKSITIKWDRIPDATQYELEVDSNIITCKNTFFSQYNLLPNTAHTYRVRAKNDLGESAWSSLLNETTYVLNTPTNIDAQADVDSITVSWQETEGATGYDIKIDETVIDNGLNTTYIHNSLLPESPFVYSVRAKNLDGTSSWSEEIYISTLPIKLDAPTNVKAYSDQNTITLAWDEVMNAQGYDIEIDSVVISNGNYREYIDMQLESNSAHTYRIRAKNDAIEGYWSESIVAQTLPNLPEAPSNVTVRNQGPIAIIKWDSVDATKNYDLVIDGDGGNDGIDDGTIVRVGSKTSYVHRRVTTNVEHTYMVRTTNVIGTSEWSNLLISNSIIARGEKNQHVDLGLTASDIQDFSQYVLKVTYDENVLDITDLSITTPQKELEIGKIDGTDIEITSFKPGEVIFTVDKYINPGESWTGIINSIKFKARMSGEVTINYLVETLR